LGTVSDEFEEQITSLDLSLYAGNMEIKLADKGGYEIRDYPTQDLKVDFSGGTLRIVDRRVNNSFSLRDIYSFNEKSPVITIYVTQQQLEKVTLSCGAGEIRMDDFSIEDLTIEAGAGTAQLNRITALECYFASGAGELSFEECDFSNVTCEVGAGDLDFSGQLRGDCSISGGVGRVKLTLDGNENDYYFNISSGVGNTSLNNRNIGGIGTDASYGSENADTTIHIDNGVGDVTIRTA
jgi:DUF4097 and DUF4098 domain-containing protein YvlB